MPPKFKKKIVMKKFAISQPKFYYHNKKVNTIKETLKELIQNLTDQNHEICYEPYPLVDSKIPSSLLIISQEMKKNF